MSAPDAGRGASGAPQSTDGADPAFPALASVPDRRGWRVARLRREVAEAVVAWINTTGDDLGAAYWDDDTVVVLRTEHLGEHGYLPHRVTPDQHGRYPLSTGTWPWITPPAHRDPTVPTPDHSAGAGLAHHQ